MTTKNDILEELINANNALVQAIEMIRSQTNCTKDIDLLNAAIGNINEVLTS